MHLFTYENGQREHLAIDFVPYFYIETKDTNGDSLSLRGHPVKRIDSDSFFKYHGKKKRCAKKDIKTFEGDLSPEIQFLVDRYLDTDLTEKENRLNYVYVDIENETDGEMPDPHNPGQKINLITAYSGRGGEYITFGLHESKVYRDGARYVHCKTEKELLKKFIAHFQKTDTDIITGWNVEGYDVPYILNRTGQLLGEDAKKSFSPLNKKPKKRTGRGRYGKKEIYYDIPGVNIVDYMEIYRNFSQGDRESYSLEYISQYEMGEGKISFDDSYKNVYKTDWEKFVDYNIQDVRLVQQLEERLGYLDLVVSIAWACKIPLHYVSTTIKKVDAVIATYLKRQGRVMDDEFLECPKEKYPGGYVLDSETGIFEWVSCLDVSSLYPSCMRQFNVSPETFVFKIPEEVALDKIEDRDVENKTIDVKKGKDIRQRKSHSVMDYIDEHDLILTPSGAVFRNKKQRHGIIPQILTDFYNRRLEVKKRLKKAEKEGDEDLEAKLDARQHAYKILMNSTYGYTGTPYCRFYNPDLAASITLAGQYYIRGCIEKLNEWFAERDEKIRKKLGTGDESDTGIVKAADTDSVFLHLGRYVPEGAGDEKAKKVVEKLNGMACRRANEIAQDITSRFDLDNLIVFDREYIARYVAYLTKKRYVYTYTKKDDEGGEKFEIKAKGFEIVKSSTPYQIREYLKDICRVVLEAQSEEAVHSRMREIHSEFLDLDPVEIAFPTSVNGIGKYRTEEGGCRKGTPIHVRAAIVWNNLLEQNDVEGYEPIIEGGKMRYVYLKQNPITDSHVVGFGDRGLPSEMGLDQYVDYEKMFQKTFMKPMDPFFEMLDWSRPNLRVSDLGSIFS